VANESITVDCPEPGLIHVHHVDVRDSGVDMGGPLWFSRDNLPWLIEQLQAVLTTYGFEDVIEERGDDSFKVFESGPEQAPVINIQNRRPKGGDHGGMFALLMSKPIAQSLLDQLQQL
jgi:hypothetical protein